MMQLMGFLYKCNAVCDLVRQYCVINVSGCCCDGAAVSQIETFQQGQWKRLNLLFILLVMFRYIAQNRCIFPYTWCLYLRQILINIPTVFSERLFAYHIMRMRVLVQSLLPRTRRGDTKEMTSDFFRVRVERKAFPRVANEKVIKQTANPNNTAIPHIHTSN